MLKAQKPLPLNYNSSDVISELKRHLSVLAHDSLEGRETGFPGIEKAARYIESQFLQMGITPLPALKEYRQHYKTPYQNQNACNVMGVIEGSDLKNEYIVLSAHYDHLGKDGDIVYNGADDDGSGTVAVLTLAKTFKTLQNLGYGPRRSILFVLFSGEEKGLWGSSYFSDHPTLPLDKVSCDINIDMIGRIDPDRTTPDRNHYVFIVGQSRLSSETSKILNTLNSKTQRLTLDEKFDHKKDPNRIYYRSDHYNFAKKGVPVVFFYDGMLGGDYHEPTDDIELIDWEIYHKR
ncbi:MAG: M28 family peptidase, partial [Bacteroidia bacterium]|nr:M28 family peptidase [Bacteroidia bacterium]